MSTNANVLALRPSTWPPSTRSRQADSDPEGSDGEGQKGTFWNNYVNNDGRVQDITGAWPGFFWREAQL